MSAKIKYSIIIPHYNVPTLLRRALSSIPQRSDTEIIVVDDASDANYKNELCNICEEKQAILFFLEQNCGGGAARNKGVECAKGEYVIFLDSDDFFNPCINDILEDYSLNNKYDVVFFKTNSVDSETMEPAHRTDYLNGLIDNYQNNPLKNEEELRYLFGVPCCKIIKKELIIQNNIKFDETRICDDTTFAYTLGYFATSIHTDSRKMYCATCRTDSMSKQKGKIFQLTTLEVLARAVIFFKKINRVYYEKELAANLYILLRFYSRESFEEGLNLLAKMGLDREYIYNTLCREMACYSYKSSVFLLLYAPVMKIKIKSLKYMLFGDCNKTKSLS